MTKNKNLIKSYHLEKAIQQTCSLVLWHKKTKNLYSWSTSLALTDVLVQSSNAYKSVMTMMMMMKKMVQSLVQKARHQRFPEICWELGLSRLPRLVSCQMSLVSSRSAPYVPPCIAVSLDPPPRIWCLATKSGPKVLRTCCTDNCVFLATMWSTGKWIPAASQTFSNSFSRG